jgi:hypothetical protein
VCLIRTSVIGFRAQLDNPGWTWFHSQILGNRMCTHPFNPWHFLASLLPLLKCYLLRKTVHPYASSHILLPCSIFSILTLSLYCV